MLATLILPALLALSPGDEVASLLQKADETLAGAQSLRARTTDTAEYAAPYRDLRQTCAVALSRSGGVRVEITRARRVRAGEPWKDTGNNTLRVADGEAGYAVFFHPESTQVRKFEPLPAPGVAESPLLAGFFGGANSPYKIYQQAREGEKLSSVRVEGSRIDFTVGKVERTVEVGGDGLVHRIVERNPATGDSRTWTLDSVELNANVPPTDFSYTPPADALPYAQSGREAGLEVGAEAPNVVLGDVDGKPLQLSDLKRKVVVLKFWATWCWPCNQSFPETEALAAKYADQNVASVAVAIKDSRKGLDVWRKRHPENRHVAFAFEDPNQPLASTAFRVTATPTVYIVGKDGRIAARIEGYTGPDPALEDAIKAAL